MTEPRDDLPGIGGDAAPVQDGDGPADDEAVVSDAEHGTLPPGTCCPSADELPPGDSPPWWGEDEGRGGCDSVSPFRKDEP